MKTGLKKPMDFCTAMDWIDRKQIGEELLNNMDLTKEQYLEFIRLAEEADLEYVYGYELPPEAIEESE